MPRLQPGWLQVQVSAVGTFEHKDQKVAAAGKHPFDPVLLLKPVFQAKDNGTLVISRHLGDQPGHAQLVENVVVGDPKQCSAQPSGTSARKMNTARATNACIATNNRTTKKGRSLKTASQLGPRYAPVGSSIEGGARKFRDCIGVLPIIEMDQVTPAGKSHDFGENVCVIVPVPKFDRCRISSVDPKIARLKP